MKLFQELTERVNTPELLSHAECLDIKPSDSVTKESAQIFWDGVFSVSQEGQDLFTVDEESLLAEIFGRFEDEFDSDFEIDDEIQAILDKFESTRWGNYSDVDRKIAVVELTSVIGEKLGLQDSPSVCFFEGPENLCGAYSQEENSISINSNTFGLPNEVVDTVAHELRHAYQHQRASIQETRLDALYRCNFENYISPVWLDNGKCLFFTDYQDQLVEAEARAFANIFTGNEVF